MRSIHRMLKKMTTARQPSSPLPLPPVCLQEGHFSAADRRQDQWLGLAGCSPSAGRTQRSLLRMPCRPWLSTEAVAEVPASSGSPAGAAAGSMGSPPVLALGQRWRPQAWLRDWAGMRASHAAAQVGGSQACGLHWTLALGPCGSRGWEMGRVGSL